MKPIKNDDFFVGFTKVNREKVSTDVFSQVDKSTRIRHMSARRVLIQAVRTSLDYYMNDLAPVENYNPSRRTETYDFIETDLMKLISTSNINYPFRAAVWRYMFDSSKVSQRSGIGNLIDQEVRERLIRRDYAWKQ